MTPNASLLGQWLTGLYGAMILALVVLQVVAFFRRKPPIEAEFATKAELRDLVKAIQHLRDSMHGCITRGECHTFRSATETSMTTLRDSIAGTHLQIIEKLDEMRREILICEERHLGDVYSRLNEIQACVARLDERSRNPVATARPLSMTSGLIARQSRKAGLQYTEPQVAPECVFLSDQGLIVGDTDPVTGAVRYRITAQGIIQHEKTR